VNRFGAGANLDEKPQLSKRVRMKKSFSHGEKIQKIYFLALGISALFM
jgi:hypothetical protein